MLYLKKTVIPQILFFIIIITILLFMTIYYLSPCSIKTYLDPVYGRTYTQTERLGIYSTVHYKGSTKSNFEQWLENESISNVYPYYQEVSIMKRSYWFNRQWEYYTSDFINIPLFIYQSNLPEHKKSYFLRTYQSEIWDSFINANFRDIINSYEMKIKASLN